MTRLDSVAATGFDFKPLPDGNVMIEFQTDSGTIINKQIVTPEVIRQMPLVAALLDVAIRNGPEAAREIVQRMNDYDFSERTKP